MYTDTPVPPDEPRAENPPDGAVLDYWLAADAGLVTIEIVNSAGRVVRKYASTDPTPAPADAGNAPWYWFRPAVAPSTRAGLRRFVWDLHYSRPTDSCSLPISATPGNTKCEPEGPWVLPGFYTVRLTVDGVVRSERLEVRMDPRVRTSFAALRKQHDLSVALYDAILEAQKLATEARAKGLAEFAGPQGFGGITQSHQAVINVLQGSDAAATEAVVRAVAERTKAWATLRDRWSAIRSVDQSSTAETAAPTHVRAIASPSLP